MSKEEKVRPRKNSTASKTFSFVREQIFFFSGMNYERTIHLDCKQKFLIVFHVFSIVYLTTKKKPMKASAQVNSTTDDDHSLKWLLFIVYILYWKRSFTFHRAHDTNQTISKTTNLFCSVFYVRANLKHSLRTPTVSLILPVDFVSVSFLTPFVVRLFLQIKKREERKNNEKKNEMKCEVNFGFNYAINS